MAAPVQRGEELELAVDSLAYGGNGVARLDGFVVFVRRGLPGDTVRARVTKVQRRHAEAEAIEVVDAGPQRVDAPCAHFPACGGCRFQDLAYEAQVAAKAGVGRRTRCAGSPGSPSRRSSRSSPAESTCSTTATRWSTRSRRAPTGAELGLHRAGRWDEVLEIERCWLTTDLGNAIRNAMRDWAREERLEAYDQADGTGYLRHLVVREGAQHGPGARPARDARARALRPRAADRGADAVPGGALDPLGGQRHAGRGDEPAERAALGRRGDRGGARRPALPRAAERVPADEHAHGRAAVRARARREAALTGSETVYDLYCGIGTIGLSLARDALTVWGIEISEESVACAIENAELNAIGNAAFFAGNVGEVLRELRERAGEPDVVVVDPPRAGLAGKALKRLGELAAPRVVYVSCNPTTLAGDAKRLREDYGYRLVRTTPGRHVPAHAARRVGLAARATDRGQAARCEVARSSGVRAAGAAAGRRQSRSAFGEQEAERDGRGSAGRPRRRPTRSRSDHRQRRGRRVMPEPRPERPQAEAHARAEEEREEERRRAARARAAPPPGTTNATESALKTSSWLLGDRASSGRARPSRRRPTGSAARRARPTRAPRRA